MQKSHSKIYDSFKKGNCRVLIFVWLLFTWRRGEGAKWFQSETSFNKTWKTIHCWPKNLCKEVNPPFSNSETELIPRFCSAKEVNHRLPLTWDGTGLLWALTGTSVQFDGSLSVLLKNTTHNIKYWQGDLNQWSLRLWPNDHYCWYISACCI